MSYINIAEFSTEIPEDHFRTGVAPVVTGPGHGDGVGAEPLPQSLARGVRNTLRDTVRRPRACAGVARPPRGAGHVVSVPPQYGETWVYESIVGALPGVDLSEPQAVALQLGLFETAVVVLGWYYQLPGAVLAGTVAVGVAAAGSVAMLRFSRETRGVPLPDPYRRLLFGSSIEVVLAVLAFVALVTHVFVFDPRLFGDLFGTDPPVVVVYLTLLVLWDLCYRIGTSWWAAVVSLWRSLRYRFDAEAAGRLRRADGINVAFAATQVVLLPFLDGQPVLQVAVAGHVVAVGVVSGAAILLLDG